MAYLFERQKDLRVVDVLQQLERKISGLNVPDIPSPWYCSFSPIPQVAENPFPLYTYNGKNMITVYIPPLESIGLVISAWGLFAQIAIMQALAVEALLNEYIVGDGEYTGQKTSYHNYTLTITDPKWQLGSPKEKLINVPGIPTSLEEIKKRMESIYPGISIDRINQERINQFLEKIRGIIYPT
uniref:Uncharacterized protein n=1 Tax=candidate division CPR3 bacterium TaxID=2268181 RepID=A0A7C5YXX2_UNCC3